MASARYTWQLDPDELKPDEPKRELSKEETVKNFWYYHKWHFLIIGVSLALVGMFVWELVTKVEPDYTIGLLSEHSIPMGIAEQLADKLEPFCDDRNGDGEVVVQVSPYTIVNDMDATVDPNMQIASVTRFSGDIQTGESMFFIVDDPENFQMNYGIFAYDDDTAPDISTDPGFEKLGHRWGSCPVLTELELGRTNGIESPDGIDIQEYLKDFKLIPRMFENSAISKNEKSAEYYKDAMAVYAKLTAGATE